MPLYVKGHEVDELATRVQRALGARTKSEAVRTALENELARVQASLPLSRRLEHAKSLAAKIGKPDPDFDMKSFTDEMWGV